MFARDVMTRAPYTLPATASVREALAIFNERGFRHIPLLDEQGALAGLVSERDLRPMDPTRFPGSLHAAVVTPLLDRPLDPFISDAVVFVSPDDPLTAVIDQLVNHRLGAVPVADAAGQVVGIISYIDVLSALRAKTA